MEWFYLLLVICILLLFYLFLNPQIRENQSGQGGLGLVNALSWYNRRPQYCWHGLNSQGCTTPHRVIF